MKVRNLVGVIVAVFLVYAFFIHGKRSTLSPAIDQQAFIAGSAHFTNVGDLYDSSHAQILKERFANLNRKGVFNGTVLYAEHGEIVYKDAFGWADFRERDSMQVDDAFQLASVSKMFTAYSIMLLKQQGRLEYEDTLGKFIPELPYANITIRQLLNHRSGLSRYMSLADKYWDINTPINNEQVIDLFVKHVPSPYFKPDKGFHYCNTNYALLASVVERISGMHFDEFVKSNVFEPLAMDNSFVYNLRGDSVIGYQVPVGVSGYRNGGWRASKVGDYYLNGVMGDKGVYSTVEDLFKFNLALDNGSLVSLDNLKEAFVPGSPPYYKRKDSYGFGWRIKDGMDSTAYHFGWWKGFRTYFVRDMCNDRALIVLTNTHRGASSSVYWDVLKDEQRPEKLLKIYQQLN